MGGCQGGFCFPKVVENIAQENGIEFEKVLKENRESFPQITLMPENCLIDFLKFIPLIVVITFSFIFCNPLLVTFVQSSLSSLVGPTKKLPSTVNKELDNLKQIEPYVMFKDKPKDEQQKLLATDENYKNIVCKCEKITKFLLCA